MNSVSFYFCPYCPGWTILSHGVCRECHRHLELSHADPTGEELRSIVGEGLSELGILVVDRGVLPRICRAWATSNGLLFSPQMKRLGHKYLLANERTLACWLAAMRRPVVTEQERNPDGIALDVVELLYGMPGGFFVTFESISEVTWTYRSCVLKTSRQRETTLKPQRRRDGVFARLKAQLDSVGVPREPHRKSLVTRP